MKYNKLSIGVIACMIILSSNAYGLTISPGIVNGGDFQRGERYNYDVYVTNQDPEPVSFTLDITPRSAYMEDFITISPGEVSLNTGETKIVTVALDVPNESSRLGNGSHQITILPNMATSNGAGVKIVSMPIIEIRFNINGTAIESLAIETFSAPDAKRGETITFEMTAKNTGDTRTEAFPFVEIQRYGSKIGLSQGYTEYILAPEKQTKMFTKYRTDNLEPGRYKAIAYAEYSGKKRTNAIEKTFKISPEDQKNTLPDEKDTTPHLSASQPRDYISIGSGDGNAQITRDIRADQNAAIEPDIASEDTAGEIRIKKLSLEGSEDNLKIIMLIENTNVNGLDYDAVFNIFSGDGIKEGIIISRGYINTGETAEIIKIWNGTKYRNHNVSAEVTYEIDGRMEKARSYAAIEIKGQENSITGNILGATSPVKKKAIIAVFILLAVAGAIVFMRRRKQILKKQAQDMRKNAEKSEEPSTKSDDGKSENLKKTN